MAFRRLLSLVVLLRLSTLIAGSIPAAVTQLTSSRSLSQLPTASIALHADITPFPVPNTPITLKLYDLPGDPLSLPDVNIAVTEALVKLFVFVRETGDRPLPKPGIHFLYGSVSIEVHPTAIREGPSLLYTDVVSVLRGLSRIENHLGFTTRYMDIFHTNKGYLGDALIGQAYRIRGQNETSTS